MNAVTPSVLNPTHHLARGMAFVRAIGPYAAIELILPGGTLFAVLFWLYRRYQRGEPLPPVIARSLFKLRLGVDRLVEAARTARRPSLGHRDVAASDCVVCVRS